MNRREVRETVLKALYAFQMSKDSLDHIMKTVVKDAVSDDKETRRFAEQLLFRTVEQQDDLDIVIAMHIRNWEIQRLAAIDRLILQMSLCEFLNFEEIPTKVTINEAIEIAKRYSTAKSSRFINGILDAALEDLNEQGRINKTGRGLINKTVGKE
ncbi:transcription antitermination factor NusB [Balneola sp. MJW-20]|uniref:transcription antitermination factor NusB n=1 Tax=Gracilimonas aurantiaca TaxID=3234185 RepID=UPI003465256C